MKYIKKIDNRRLYDDGIGGVDLFDFSHANDNEESRVEAVATVASICYGKPPKDAEKLVKRLQTESGGLPSSAFEFVRSAWSPDIESSLRNMPKQVVEAAASDLFPTIIERTALEHRANVAIFRIKVPIFIARQVMRHRSFSYQELSRRYSEADLEWWLPEGESFIVRSTFSNVYWGQHLAYQRLLEDGVPREQARAVLGTGLYTEFWMMGNTAAWRNYFKLRLDPHTQKEHRELAVAMADLLKEHQPVLWAAVDPQGAE